MAIDRGAYAPRSTPGRIAVLPCDDLSPDPNDSYFAAGIHEELLTRLGQIRNLRLISRSSVLQYADHRPPIPQIGADLGADTIMECSVRYNGDQVMLTAQLIDAATDEHLWSQSYPGDISDLHSLYEIQADIATNVANALRVAFFDEELAQIKQARHSAEARAFYLASVVDTSSIERKIELVEQALEFDSEFIEAWIQKARLHILDAGFMTGDESAAAHAAALEAANRAVVLDPNSGGAHAMLAVYHGQLGDWMNSEIEWRRRSSWQKSGKSGGPLTGNDGSRGRCRCHHGDGRQPRPSPMNTLVRSFLLLAYEVVGKKDKRSQHWKRGEALFVDMGGDGTETMLRILDTTESSCAPRCRRRCAV